MIRILQLLRPWLAAALLPASAVLRAEDAPSSPIAAGLSADLVVFGATPAGIAAAVSAARLGDTVILAEPSYLVGGMVAGGLTKTDIGQRETVGGVSAEFFDRVATYYKKTYGPDSPQHQESRGGIFFEPRVAAQVYRELLAEAGVRVLVHRRLVSAEVDETAGAIATVTVRDYTDGAVSTLRGRQFIDATYEGDLMAAVHVPYRVGREARAEYGETLAGLESGPEEYIGKGDHRLQAFNFRSTVTNRPDLRLPFPKPAIYDRAWHSDFVRAMQKRGHVRFSDVFLFAGADRQGGVNGKADPNRADYPGANYTYAEADYEMRELISARIRDYWLAFWWTMQNEPDLPESFKAGAREWGLPKDEFAESGHISPQVYVREARRMLGRYFLTEKDLLRYRHKDDAICLASYNIDSHHVQYLRTPEGLVGEGHLIVGVDPYELPYRILTPYAPGNLLVACAVSASHIAYGSLRMEPVFMMTGQAAGTAAHLARTGGITVQDISVPDLQGKLKAAGIPLAAPFRPVVKLEAPAEPLPVGRPVTLRAVTEIVRAPIKNYRWNFDGSGAVQSEVAEPVVTFPVSKPVQVSLMVQDADGNWSCVEERTLQVGDDATPDVSATATEATRTGRWIKGSSRAPERRDREAFHDGNTGKGDKQVVFAVKLPRTGRYRVAFAWQALGNRARAVPISIRHADGVAEVVLNQRERAGPFTLAPLGDYRFEAGRPAEVTLKTAGTEGYVSIDEVRWIWLGP